jgi:Zinc-binding dehydrogenase
VLRELLKAGTLTPVIDRTYPLAATAEAIGSVGQRHSQGKTVLTMLIEHLTAVRTCGDLLLVLTGVVNLQANLARHGHSRGSV